MSSEPSVALRDFRVYIMTWNVVCRGPIEDLHSALGLDPPVTPESLPDMYAIGFQEVSARPQCLLRQAFFEEPWIQAVRTVLRKYRYVKVKHVRLQGLVLTIFTKREHLTHLRGCMSTYTRTGLGGVWGNKGGVTVRMIMYGCSICFVNCHLAAHEGELAQRINEYNAIIDKQTFDDTKANNILNHDYAFWFGDLNFRLDVSMADIRQSIENGKVDRLLQNDQLLRVRTMGKAFHDFTENEVTFGPTYKCVIDSSGYDFSRRKPAWTDRILYRCKRDTGSNVALDVRQSTYESHDLYIQSDHKPVSGYFTIKVFAQPEEPFVVFFPVTPWTVNQECFAWYYTSPGTEVQPSDWVALYRDNFTSLEDHISYVWAPTHPLDALPSSLVPYVKNLNVTGQRASTSPATALHSDMKRHRKSVIESGPLSLDDDTKPSSPTSMTSASPPSMTSASPSPTSVSPPTCASPMTSVSPISSEEPTSKDNSPRRSQTQAMRRKSTRASLSWNDDSRGLGLGRTGGYGSLHRRRSVSMINLRSISEEMDTMDEASGNSTSPWVRAMCSDEPLPTDEDAARDSRRSEPSFFRVLFSGQGLLLVGKYRLLYLRGDTDVLGMSSAFKVKTPLLS